MILLFKSQEDVEMEKTWGQEAADPNHHFMLITDLLRALIMTTAITSTSIALLAVQTLRAFATCQCLTAIL